MAQLDSQNEVTTVGLEDGLSSNDLVAPSNTHGPLGDSPNEVFHNQTEVQPRLDQLVDLGGIELRIDPVETIEEAASGGRDPEERDSIDNGGLEDRGAVRQQTAKRPPAFKAVSVTKSFLAKSGSGLSSPLKSAGERGPPSAPLLSGSRPRLVAKLVPSQKESAPPPSGAESQSWRNGSGPDPKEVWNKNRVASNKTMKTLTDEEMIKHGIHLATRLQREGANKESDWADLSDDEDDWTATPVKWADGTQLNSVKPDAQSARPSDLLARRDGKPLKANLKPTVVPMPAGTKAEMNGRARTLGTIGQSRLGNLTLRGASDSKPSATLRTVAMASPARSPWAKLPPVDIISPANPKTEMELEDAINEHLEETSTYRAPAPSERPQISVDDFQRHRGISDSSSHKELFNSTSGRYESVDQMRRMSRGQDHGYRQPAVLQRSTDQIDQPHRVLHGGANGQIESISSTDTTSMPASTNINQGLAIDSEPVLESSLVPKSTYPHTVEPQIVHAVAPTPPDPIALQEKIMQESRALALKRRKDQEEKDETERKERIKRRLAAMDASSEFSLKQVNQPVIESSPHVATEFNQPKAGQLSDGQAKPTNEGLSFDSTMRQPDAVTHHTHEQIGLVPQATYPTISEEALTSHRTHPSAQVNGFHGEHAGVRSYSPLDVDSRSQSAHHNPSVAMPNSGGDTLSLQAGSLPSPSSSHSVLTHAPGITQMGPFGRAGTTPVTHLSNYAFGPPREYETSPYRSSTSRYFPAKPGPATTERGSIIQGAPGLSQPTNQSAPPAIQASPWPSVPPSRFSHWQVGPQNFNKPSPTSTFVPPPPSEDIWIQTVSGPGATRIRTTQPSTNTPEASLRGLNHYDIPAIRPSPTTAFVASAEGSQPPVTVPTRGSRFFPMPTAADQARASQPIDVSTLTTSVVDDSNDDHPIYGVETHMPRVQLPPQRPVVKLPPLLDDVPSLSSEQDIDPSLSSLTPHDEPQQSMDWQAKFQALIGRGNQAGQRGTKSVQTSPQYTNATATVVLPTAQLVPPQSSDAAGSSQSGAFAGLSTVSKECMEDLMGEQEFGSLPPVKLPIPVQVNAWAKPVVFRDAWKDRPPAPVYPQSKEGSSSLIEVIRELTSVSITIKFPGQEKENIADPGVVAAKIEKPSAVKPSTTSGTGKRGPPRRTPFAVKPRNRAHQTRAVSQKQSHPVASA